jgi:site-specific recombinase XerD
MAIKKIKDNISPKEFKFLLNYTSIDSSLRSQRRDRLLKLFNLLYITGLRVNETSQFTNKKIKELIENRVTKIVAHKQKTEKFVYITEKGAKELSRYFDIINDNDLVFTSERGSKNSPLAINSVIRDINFYLKKVFPNKNFTSHSFRQTLITELAEKNINTKTIQTLIGHKSITSTYRYIKPSQEQILNSLDLVR